MWEWFIISCTCSIFTSVVIVKENVEKYIWNYITRCDHSPRWRISHLLKSYPASPCFQKAKIHYSLYCMVLGNVHLLHALGNTASVVIATRSIICRGINWFIINWGAALLLCLRFTSTYSAFKHPLLTCEPAHSLGWRIESCQVPLLEI